MRILAFKKEWGKGHEHLVACEKDDREASVFEVRYTGMLSQSDIVVTTSLYKAEEFIRQFTRCFEAGKKEAMKDLRKFIGVK